MENIVCVKLIDECEDTDLIYYFKKEENFDNKLAEFKKLLKEYSNFQEVEDFIFDNFTEVNIETIELSY